MQNKNILSILLALIIGIFLGYFLNSPIETGDQSAAVQKTIPPATVLKITASPVVGVGQLTTLTWSSPTLTSLVSCQGTASDKYGLTIPSAWNGPQASLNAGNNYQSTLVVPVQINEVNFKIKCQSALGAGTSYTATVKSTIGIGGSTFNISIDPPSILSGQAATITYTTPSQATYCAPYTFPNSTGTGDWLGTTIATGATSSAIVHPPGMTGYVTEYGISCLIQGSNNSRSTAVIIR